MARPACLARESNYWRVTRAGRGHPVAARPRGKRELYDRLVDPLLRAMKSGAGCNFEVTVVYEEPLG